MSDGFFDLAEPTPDLYELLVQVGWDVDLVGFEFFAVDRDGDRSGLLGD
jgi:hypothetical protein